MPNVAQLPFMLSVALNLTVSAFLFRELFWPTLRSMPIADAARPILWLHAFRFFGLTFIAPGVTHHDLPYDWAWNAAIGDVMSAALAWIALYLRKGPVFFITVWIFNFWGLADILNAFAHGVPLNVQSLLGTAYFIPTVYVPPLIMTHLALFILLVRNRKA
jgi:hypothetical protein